MLFISLGAQLFCQWNCCLIPSGETEQLDAYQNNLIELIWGTPINFIVLKFIDSYERHE